MRVRMTKNNPNKKVLQAGKRVWAGDVMDVSEKLGNVLLARDDFEHADAETADEEDTSYVAEAEEE